MKNRPRLIFNVAGRQTERGGDSPRRDFLLAGSTRAPFARSFGILEADLRKSKVRYRGICVSRKLVFKKLNSGIDFFDIWSMMVQETTSALWIF
ncbi:MAG: hypothetical protein KDD83_22470 [Caldilineaceae bacterium]|nr:hypothetical protein [Caldilineaceae bacterium]